MKVENVDYAKLQQSPTLLNAFTTSVTKAIADAAGPNIKEEHVSVKLSAGSVVVEATITPPAGVDVSTVESALTSKSTALAETVTNSVKALPGIDAVSTGPISVSGVQVTSSNTSGTERPGSTTAGTSRMSVTLTMLLVAAILLAGGGSY